MRELVALFLRLGFTAFGGPAAHIAMMRIEVVDRRKWLTEQEFLDLVGASNLIPGPSSTEVAHHIGYLRAGWRGMLVAGACFIAPAMLIVLAIAMFYTRYNELPAVAGLLYGVKPVVIAIILHALWSLGRAAIKNAWLLALGVVVLVAYFLGLNEILLLLGSGLLVMLIKNYRRISGIKSFSPLPFSLWVLPALVAQPFTLGALFLTFFKIGAVMYGSGYVLLAFLRADFVERLGWLTDTQLLDAVAIGQFTPGPLFTTATFIGYLLGDVPGAVVATIGIFLPSFVLVALTNPWIGRVRESAWAAAFLDGVNAAALALMAAVTWQLGRASIIDAPTMLLALAAAVILFRYKINSAWLVLGGALVGLLLALIN